MFTKEQQKWLNHLSNTKKITIVPYNPIIKEVFKIIKAELRKVLGNVRISHRGSTAMKISGQGEIDLYIPVCRRYFNDFVAKLSTYLGDPKSLYKFNRAKFVKNINDIKIEIFIINKNDISWKSSVKFEKYLKGNPKALVEYERLKCKADGQSMRQYYTLKISFINKILQKIIL